MKKKKKKTLIGKIVFFLILVILTGMSLRLFLFFRSGHLPKKGRINIGFSSNPYLISSFSLKRKSLVFLLIPARTLIQAVGGYGQYRIEAFDRLEEVEKKPFLLEESLAFHLSLPIEGSIKEVSPLPEEVNSKSLKKWSRNQIWSLFWKNKETNLRRFDLLKLWFLSMSVKTADIKVVSLEKEWGLRELELPDGSLFYEFDLDKTDQLVKDFFSEEEIRGEKLAIGVVNATNHQGLAKRAARIVSNLGGEVIRIADWDESFSFSQVRLKSKKEISFTARKLSRVFSCPIEEGKLDSWPIDVLLIVGDDFGQKINFRR